MFFFIEKIKEIIFDFFQNFMKNGNPKNYKSAKSFKHSTISYATKKSYVLEVRQLVNIKNENH